MATDAATPLRDPTPTASPLPSSIPQKRAPEDGHSPAVSSPLNPEVKIPARVQVQAPDESSHAMAREKRTKKESLKKRESKGSGASGAESARVTPDPRRQDVQLPLSGLAPIRYKLPPPKVSDFDPPRGPVFTSHHVVQDPAGKDVEFFETSDHVYNKKNFHYTHCIADPTFPSSLYYRQTEPEPHGPHMSFGDAATHLFFDRSGRHVTTDKGFRMARANVAVREGRWYWECKITRGTLKTARGAGSGDAESHGHVRVGWARREASLDAPVGFDAYSYGIRDVAGQKVHMSRPKDFFPPGEDLREGDVIGLEIQLPPERLHRKIVQGQYNPAVDLLDDDSTGDDGPDLEAPNIVRDRIPIRFKAHIYFEKIEYHTTKELEDLMNPSGVSGLTGPMSEAPSPMHRSPSLRTLPGSHIKVYKNGVLVGTPWTDLLAFLPPASRFQAQAAQPGAREGLDDGTLGYYPAVSVFRGGAAEVNFGPDFWYPPPGLATTTQEGEDVKMEDATTTSGQESGPGPDAVNGRGAGPPIRPVSERYDEQIVEDVVYDVIDEVAFWIQDGAQVIDRTVKDEKAGGEAAGTVSGREEIKELVQDD